MEECAVIVFPEKFYLIDTYREQKLLSGSKLICRIIPYKNRTVFNKIVHTNQMLMGFHYEIVH